MTDQQISGNIARFICFRMFFNARFYYPVFALFFLEHGLTWVEFGILNGIWAISIILLEVPSGALADTIGRKKLSLVAALCMVILVSTLFIVQDGIAGLPVSYILLPAQMEKSRFEPKMDMMISHGHIILSLTGKKMPTLNG